MTAFSQRKLAAYERRFGGFGADLATREPCSRSGMRKIAPFTYLSHVKTYSPYLKQGTRQRLQGE